MPSPIAHSVTGYALARLLRVQYRPPSNLHHLLMAIAIITANFADIDFISKLDLNFLPYWFQTNLYHRGVTHSLIAVFSFSVMATILGYGLRCSWYRQLFLFTGLVYSSHLLLDFFTSGGSGMPIFWPLIDHTFLSQIPLFPPVHHSRGLIDVSHLIFIGFESVYALLLLKGIQIVEAFLIRHRLQRINLTSTSIYNSDLEKPVSESTTER
jgi:inner membrane protein